MQRVPRPGAYTWTMHRVRGVVWAIPAPVVVASILLAGCASPAPVPSREPAGSVPSGVPTETGGLALGDIHWIYTPPPSPAGGPEGSYNLQAGSLADDAPILDLDIPWRGDPAAGPARQPAIGAPQGGAVVYVADDGAESEVHRVEIAAPGADEVLATLNEVVWDIVVAPDGSAAYAAIVDRADVTRDLGVARILLDGSGSVERILPPAAVGAADALRRVAELAFQVHLAISSDGRHLVRRTCQEAGTCVVEVIDLATGRSVELPDREVLGVVAGVIVARGCGVQGCGLEAIDVETRATALAGIDVFGPVVEVGEDPVVVAVVSDGRGTITVEAVNPAGGRTDVLYRVADGAEVGYGDFLFLQMDLPAGLVHVIEMTPDGGGAAMRVDQRHLLISVADRRVIEIPAPAVRHPPGFGIQG